MTNFKKAIFGILLTGCGLILFNSCGNHGDQVIPKTKKNGDKGNQAGNEMVSKFGKPTPVDSTSVILYPLSMVVTEGIGDELIRYSSEYNSGPFWNIAFYDSATGALNLLDSGRTIRINTFKNYRQ